MREVKRRLIYEYRYDERLKTKNEESTLLTDKNVCVTLQLELFVYYESIKRGLKRRLIYSTGESTGPVPVPVPGLRW